MKESDGIGDGRSEYHARAAEDGVGLLGDDAVVGHGELVAGAEGTAEGERDLLVEEHGLARHEGEGPGDVVLVQVRVAFLCGKAVAGRLEGFLPLAEPVLRADESEVHPKNDRADKHDQGEGPVPAEDLSKVVRCCGQFIARCLFARWFFARWFFTLLAFKGLRAQGMLLVGNLAIHSRCHLLNFHFWRNVRLV